MSRRAESRTTLPFPISGVLVRNPEGYTVSTLSSVTDTLLRAGGAGLLYDSRGTTDDGDARVDLAVYQQNTGNWIVWLSSLGYASFGVSGWGGPAFVPVQAY